MKCNLHRYRRKNIGSKTKPFIVFSCTDCTHYLRPELFVGKEARCFKCEETFVTTNKSKTMAKVRCDNCIDTKYKEQNETVEELMARLGVK